MNKRRYRKIKVLYSLTSAFKHGFYSTSDGMCKSWVDVLLCISYCSTISCNSVLRGQHKTESHSKMKREDCRDFRKSWFREWTDGLPQWYIWHVVLNISWFQVRPLTITSFYVTGGKWFQQVWTQSEVPHINRQPPVLSFLSHIFIECFRHRFLFYPHMAARQISLS